MEKNYMHSDAVAEFEFVEEQYMKPHEHENPEILFVLEGELRVKTDQQEYNLSGEDFLLINANRIHSYQAQRKLLAVRFQISMEKISKMLHKNMVLFWCCSTFENSNAYDEMRKLLKDILFYSVNMRSKDEFYVKSLHYQLMSLLCGKFLLDDKSVNEKFSAEKNHMSQILAYIRSNYQNRISLQDVADALFLSPTYLSKYISRNFGKGFIDLTNTVRLSHAMEDLMYTDIPVIKIAMNNGFASVAAFNKVFKETYHTTPSAYRKQKKRQKDTMEYMEQTEVYLHKYLKKNNHVKIKNESFLSLPAGEFRPMKLENLMNAGEASDLLKATTQNKILYCKRKLGIKYVRFWNIFDADMYLNENQKKGRFNYRNLDEILDFLVKQHLRPYIELQPKPLRLLRTANAAVHEREYRDYFTDIEENKAFFDDFFGHLIRRYNREEVNTWIFSYSIENDTKFEEYHLIGRLIDEPLWEIYLKEFDMIAASLKCRFPDAIIGGAGFPVQHYTGNRMRAFFERWKMHSMQPDFISITSFPYHIVQEGGSWYEQRRADFNFVKEDINIVRSAMEATGFGSLNLHLTEYNLTLSDRSYINDSMIRAAFIANTSAHLYDKVDMLGIWNAFDAYSEFADSSNYLFGGSGFLTKTGIVKPAGFVLYFIHQLYRESAMEKEGCLITSNEYRHYKLLVHHLVDMDMAYYLKEEDQLSALSIEQMIKTNEHKLIHVRITDIPDGCWQVRKYCLNQNAGSILTEWLNLDPDTELRMEELSYLERVYPRMYTRKQYAKNHTLEFDIELEPNEVQYLHITEFN